MGQTTGLVPVQTPAMHTSVCVQRLPSLHMVPSGRAGFEQPVAGLQTPAPSLLPGLRMRRTN